MRRLYFVVIFSVVATTTGFSQVSNCTQVIRLMRSQYEQGRLHELPSLSEACLVKGFTDEEKKEAYRYLTLAYIYLEEPEKADEMMLKLLDTDHFYEVNTSIDPAEFIALFNKFRHNPLFRIGFKVGVNTAQPTSLNYYNIGSSGGGDGKYALKANIQFIASFEKDLTKKIVIAPELGFVTRGYKYSNSNLGFADEDPTKSISSQNFAISQQWLDLNAIVQYKFKNTINIQTYLGGGPGISYLLGSSNQASTLLGNGFTVTGGAVDDKKSYNQLVYSFTAMAGIKFKIGELYATADLRYQYGLVNVINKSSRTNAELAFDYQGQYNDYRMSNLSLNVGIIYPYFKPKKLIK